MLQRFLITCYLRTRRGLSDRPTDQDFTFDLRSLRIGLSVRFCSSVQRSHFTNLRILGVGKSWIRFQSKIATNGKRERHYVSVEPALSYSDQRPSSRC